MKLLFIQGGSRWKFDDKGNAYTDANFNENIWNRYRAYCDELTVVLKKEDVLYEESVARNRYNLFDIKKSKLIDLLDIYRPVYRFINMKYRKIINERIEEAVKEADAVIIRSLGTYYTNTALKYVRKYKKPHLVEETGFSFEALWYHSLLGKLAAIPNEITTRYLMKDVPWAIYVTNEALQKRYPCSGRSLGCSDVEIKINVDVLEKRLKRNLNRKIILGTAAFLDVGWKGQIYVIRALAKLKKKGICNFEYQLIGAGTGKILQEEAQKLGIVEEVRIIGALPHEKVFDWLDSIDVYIQTSFMEGLCRSIIEAMSRGCPVLCTDVGGNYELVDGMCLMKKGNATNIAIKIEMMLDNDFRRNQSKRNFETAKQYEMNHLNYRRNNFYKEFLNTINIEENSYEKSTIN